MPSKYVVRSFNENSCYHVFNRGVEKRTIFKDDQDYKVFSYYLFIYLAPLQSVLTKYPKLPLRLQAKNLNDQVKLIAHCLMPNHFHFLLRQKTKDATSRFMKQLTNAYTQFFNTKYQRTGSLMQGRFKTVPVNSDNLLLHISRYIHLNPYVSGIVNDLKNYPWSSYLDYIDGNKKSLYYKEIILNQFSSEKDYQKFVQDHSSYAYELEKIKHLTIE